MQLKVVWSLSLQTGSEGPALISNAASRFPMFRVPRSWHTVVRVTHHVHFQACPPCLRKLRRQPGLETVQCHVSQGRADNSPLRGTCLSREELVLIHESRLEPLL